MLHRHVPVTLPTTAVYRLGVSDAGSPAVVYDHRQAGDTLPAPRLGLGPDPAAVPVTPTDVETGNEIGSLVVGADGSPGRCCGLVAGPDGWVHLVATDYVTDGLSSVLLLDLGTGELAAPVELCPDSPGQPFGLVRSAFGTTGLAWATCERTDSRVVVLSGD